MQCGILHLILEQQKDINRKASEISETEIQLIVVD